MFSSIMKAAVAASILLGSPVFADLGKPVLFSDGLGPHVNDPLMANMPSTQSTDSSWAWGWIPDRCANEAKNANPPLSLYDFEVFNVNYADCSEAWIFCRHTQAQLSKSQLIDYFGRLPVHERETVSYVMAVPGGGSAYETGGMVVFQGTSSISVFQHEVGHAVDAYSNTDGQSSNTQEFLDAIDNDTCVPDSYADTNNVEDYTQVGVLLMYNTVVPGGLNGIGANWDCLANQIFVVAARQQLAMQLGGTCDWRQSYGDVISMGPASGNNKRSLGPKPVMTLVEGHPLVKIVDTNRKSAVHTYTDIVLNATEDALAAERQKAWNAAARHRAVRSIV